MTARSCAWPSIPSAAGLRLAAMDQTVRLWPMPDLSKPPLHTLPREELIAKLKTLTNLRVVRDEESPPVGSSPTTPSPAGRRCRSGDRGRGRDGFALHSTHMGILARDTGESAERVQIAMLKALPVWQRMKLLDDACATTRSVVLAGLRSRFPDFSDSDLHRMLMDVLVGEETAERIWGPRANPNR